MIFLSIRKLNFFTQRNIRSITLKKYSDVKALLIKDDTSKWTDYKISLNDLINELNSIFKFSSIIPSLLSKFWLKFGKEKLGISN